jgi:hypothetical protein
VIRRDLEDATLEIRQRSYIGVSMTISNELLTYIEKGIKHVEINFSDNSWRDTIPSDSGWYFIETTTPPNAFQSVGPPKGERHYNIPQKASASLSLKNFGFCACIFPSQNSFYFVYSGEAKDLKARAREHQSGHGKTGCLALANYPALHRYKWRFRYAICGVGKNHHESKLLRTYGEQLWRAKYGWPLLCGK